MILYVIRLSGSTSQPWLYRSIRTFIRMEMSDLF